MSKSIAKAYTKEKTDELYTPKILVECLNNSFDSWAQKFIDDNKRAPIVWCPFDKKSSEFIYYFNSKEYKDYYEGWKVNEYQISVEFSHIDYGQDFFKYEPDQWDIAISNPPFSRKLDVFKRLNYFEKPWAMIMNTMALNYMEIGNYFTDNPIQLLIPDKRVSFDGNPSSFNSSYVCKDFLQTDLKFVHLPHCNSGKDYIPSRMYKDEV